MYTTLNKIREHSPCANGWTKLLKHLGKTTGDDVPLPMTTILDANGIDDAIWALRTLTGHDRDIRLFAVGCARHVQHLMTDPRSLAALDVAERYANGGASESDLTTARDAATAAYAATSTTAYAAAAAATTAYAAYAAAYAAAYDAATSTSTSTTAYAAATREKQVALFREIFG